MNGLTRETLVYRPWRLRRLVAVASLVPVPALVSVFGFAAPAGWAILALWTLAVLAYVAVFPNGWTDLLSIAATVALTIVAVPLVVPYRLDPGQVALVGLVGLSASWLGANLGFVHLARFPAPWRRLRYRCRLPLAPDAARAAFFLRPDTAFGHRLCGPRAEDGTFEVQISALPVLAPPEDPFRFGTGTGAPMPDRSGAAQPFRMRAAVVSTAPDRQETLCFGAFDGGRADVGAQIETLRPAASGSDYEKLAMAPAWSLYAALGHWINDIDGDCVTDTLDRWAGRPSRANRSAPGESLLSLVARKITAMEPGPRRP